MDISRLFLALVSAAAITAMMQLLATPVPMMEPAYILGAALLTIGSAILQWGVLDVTMKEIAKSGPQVEANPRVREAITSRHPGKILASNFAMTSLVFFGSTGLAVLYRSLWIEIPVVVLFIASLVDFGNDLIMAHDGA